MFCTIEAELCLTSKDLPRTTSLTFFDPLVNWGCYHHNMGYVITILHKKGSKGMPINICGVSKHYRKGGSRQIPSAHSFRAYPFHMTESNIFNIKIPKGLKKNGYEFWVGYTQSLVNLYITYCHGPFGSLKFTWQCTLNTWQP